MESGKPIHIYVDAGKRGLTLQDAAILPWNAETPVDQDMKPIG